MACRGVGGSAFGAHVTIFDGLIVDRVALEPDELVVVSAFWSQPSFGPVFRDLELGFIFKLVIK